MGTRTWIRRIKRASVTRIFLLLSVLVLASCPTIAQSPAFDINQQDALDLLKSLARNLKSEPDKLAAGRLQARIADELWSFDEPFARDTFRSAFTAVTQPFPDNLPRDQQAGYIQRQASAVKDVLRRFGAHDDTQAAAWLKTFESEAVGKNATSKADTSPELLMQIAAQIAMTDPDQAAKLGLVALSGDRIPEGFGVLLFSLNRSSRNLSDELFRAAIATLRRSNYSYDSALFSLTNYLFTGAGELHSNAQLADARLLANMYVDAAWKQAGGDGSPAPPSSVSFYNLLELRALPIVARYTPSRLPELRGQLARIASSLTAEQLQRTEILRTSQQQEAAIWSQNNYSIDEQIAHAEKEKNIEVRDALFLSIANKLMREDSDRALTLAKKIDDPSLRTTIEDDIYLVKIVGLLQSQSFAEARKLSLQFSNPVFRAKVLAQLAARVWSTSKDQTQTAELLSEALTATAKGDDLPDKVLAQLHVAQQFARFDSVRAFEVLATALATLNRLKAEKAPADSATKKRPLLRMINITVVNGVEMTTTNDATVDSIDFREVSSLAVHDYVQAKLLASKLDQPVQRANYLTSVAASVLKTQHPTSSTRK
jgi:hypothetical protein